MSLSTLLEAAEFLEQQELQQQQQLQQLQAVQQQEVQIQHVMQQAIQQHTTSNIAYKKLQQQLQQQNNDSTTLITSIGGSNQVAAIAGVGNNTMSLLRSKEMIVSVTNHPSRSRPTSPPTIQIHSTGNGTTVLTSSQSPTPTVITNHSLNNHLHAIPVVANVTRNPVQGTAHVNGQNQQQNQQQPRVINNSFDMINPLVIDESGEAKRKQPPLVFRSGTREVHNKLEKHRRAHLKECFDVLKKQLPPQPDSKKISNLSILDAALRHILYLRRRDKDLEQEMEQLAREKISLQQRLTVLKNEVQLPNDVEMPLELTTASTTITTATSNKNLRSPMLVPKHDSIDFLIESPPSINSQTLQSDSQHLQQRLPLINGLQDVHSGIRLSTGSSCISSPVPNSMLRPLVALPNGQHLPSVINSNSSGIRPPTTFLGVLQSKPSNSTCGVGVANDSTKPPPVTIGHMVKFVNGPPTAAVPATTATALPLATAVMQAPESHHQAATMSAALTIQSPIGTGQKLITGITSRPVNGFKFDGIKIEEITERERLLNQISTPQVTTVPTGTPLSVLPLSAAATVTYHQSHQPATVVTSSQHLHNMHTHPATTGLVFQKLLVPTGVAKGTGNGGNVLPGELSAMLVATPTTATTQGSPSAGAVMPATATAAVVTPATVNNGQRAVHFIAPSGMTVTGQPTTKVVPLTAINALTALNAVMKPVVMVSTPPVSNRAIRQSNQHQTPQHVTSTNGSS